MSLLDYMRTSRLAKILGGLAFIPLVYVSFEVVELQKTYNKGSSFKYIKPSIIVCVGSYKLSENEVFYVKKCDIDNDNKADTINIYKTKSKDNLYVPLDYPLIYMIDKNKNRKIDENDGEFIIDSKMDGLNGNETEINESDKKIRKYGL